VAVTHHFKIRVIKGFFIILWVILFGLLLQRDYFISSLETRETIALARDARTEFQGIYFKNSKIGHVETQYIPQDDMLAIKQRAQMNLNIAGSTQPINLSLSAILNSDNTLHAFDFNFSSLFYQMIAHGVVDGTRVSFSLDTGSSTIEDYLDLKSPPMLSTSRRHYLLRENIETGDKIRIPWFDPVSLSAKNSTIEYRGKERILIHDRIYNLHRFIEHFSGSRVSSWLDDEGNVLKEESPAGFVFIKEPEFQARELDTSSADLLASVAVTINGSMPVDLFHKKSMRYRLTLPAEHTFNLNQGRQTFTENILTIKKELMPADTNEAEYGCEGRERGLEASPYIQAEAPEIIEQSRAITAELPTEKQKTEALATWVNQELEKRPVLGIPDALTTLKNRIGDCNENASLFAALARAAEIPTKIVAGVVFHKGAFYYHAWNEVCLSGQWISLDTTTAQLPADLSHIKFVEGELREQIQIGSLLGTLQIEVLTGQN